MFVALTRPQMFAGVTYSYFVVNGVIATELFLIFQSIWVLAVGAWSSIWSAWCCACASRASSTCG